MAEYKLRNKATEDLSEIWEHTFDIWSEKQADKYYGELILNCQEISQYPDLGKATKEYLNTCSDLRLIGISYFIEF